MQASGDIYSHNYNPPCLAVNLPRFKTYGSARRVKRASGSARAIRDLSHVLPPSLIVQLAQFSLMVITRLVLRDRRKDEAGDAKLVPTLLESVTYDDISNPLLSKQSQEVLIISVAVLYWSVLAP